MVGINSVNVHGALNQRVWRVGVHLAEDRTNYLIALDPHERLTQLRQIGLGATHKAHRNYEYLVRYGANLIRALSGAAFFAIRCLVPGAGTFGRPIFSKLSRCKSRRTLSACFRLNSPRRSRQ